MGSAVLEESLRGVGEDPEGEIAALTEDPEADYAEYWARAKTNLLAGRIRLVFVADVVPAELQRVVEFLNERMSPTEVIAVEIRQYKGGGEQMLVPRVLGQTAEARQRKSSTASRGSKRWDEPSFLEEPNAERGLAADGAREILESAGAHFSGWVGEGRGEGTVALALVHDGSSYWPFYLGTSGTIEIYFHGMKGKPPFDQPGKRFELLRKLNEIPGVNLPETAIERRPRIPLTTFSNPDALAGLIDVFNWFLGEVRAPRP